MEETKYRCGECGERFENQIEWEQHRREVHSRYTCQNGGETFNAEEEFEDHNLRIHPELPRTEY